MRRAAGGLLTVCLTIAVTACGNVSAPSLPAPTPVTAPSPSSPLQPAPPLRGPVSRPESFLAPARSTAPPRAAQPTPVARIRQLNEVADYCADRDVAATPVDDPVLTVLDRTHMLPVGYAPPDLTAASAAGYSGNSGTKLVRAVITDDLAALRGDSAAAGLRIQLQSTYRSYASQVGTFNHWVSIYGMAGALLRSARPGHSEHQLGTTIDFTSPGWGGRFGNWATQTREGAWLAANGWRYGFVMSYPLGTQATTCFSYEPWHYRWIGRAAAAAWHASGQTLHAYLESLD